MQKDFIKANCHGCKWSLFAGEDAQGQPRIQRCLFRFTDARTNAGKAQRGGDNLLKLQTCPKMEEKAA